ncbi:MAG: hypothetical protein PHQ59_01855 [Candidatus Daviesbacteria bacterium]|nr:hypothetical protein [Candidatus Daviesbacteria bacterium]
MPEDKNKEEQTELEKLLNEPDEGADEGGENEDENKGKEGEEENKGGEGEGQEENENGEGEGEGEGEGSDEGEEDEFKGKSREEVIKMLKDQRKANADAAKGKGKDDEGDDKDKNKDKEEDELTVPTAEELQKMTPSDFAKWVLSRIDEGVKKTIESQSKVQSAVRKEIADAKKEHNLGDPDYRKMVLAIIEAASAKGTVIPLKDACLQVDAFLGKNKGKGEGESEQLSDEEKSRLKKAKAQVESGAGAPTKPDGSDAESQRIQKALGGSGQNSPLGGLGI